MKSRSAKAVALQLGIAMFATLALARSAAAELIFFNGGQSMSVKSHRVDGDSLVLALRTGGEMVMEKKLVARIEPDEVPYPEPEEPAAKPQTNDEADATTPYGDIIDQAAAQHGVPARLVKAMIQVESAYQPRARSRKGAMGLMQLMPD